MYRRYRRAVQIALFAAMFLIPILNLYEIYQVTGTFYAINIGGLGVADPVVIFQAVFAAARLTVPLISAALFPVFLALIFGRIWCGWMCPYHLLADCAAWVRARVLRKNSAAPRSVGSFGANVSRFAFLVMGTVAAGAIGIPVLNYFSAPGILSTEAMIFVKERSASVELVFIALLLGLELSVLPRFWCRMFCPTGAFLSLFRAPFTLRVKNDVRNPKSQCCQENHCSLACPMKLHPYRECGDLLCTNCGLCVDACRSGRLKYTGYGSL
ncbi:MAG TPA: 4Fe-4S binding protein [Desulfomonilaceae bacterium]|nr:4Fe-4S binding protein [Desulfomonilaceae bacterium]